MKLIIVQGGAATGKSTVAKYLSKSLDLPNFLKDDYKERIFDQEGSNRGLLRWYKLEEQSYKEIYKAAAAAINADTSLIVEGNFLPFRKRQIRGLLRTNCYFIEIYCYAGGWLMFKRYIHRNERDNRHKGHKDRLWYGVVFLECLCAQLGFRWYRPLRLSNNLLKVNTSKPSSIDYANVLKFIQKAS